MTIAKAVKLIKEYNKQAEEINKARPGMIKTPVAWALYRVWREADSRR